VGRKKRRSVSLGNGNYQILLTGLHNGTYELSVSATSVNHQSSQQVFNGAILQGEIVAYQLNLITTNLGQTQTVGLGTQIPASGTACDGVYYGGTFNGNLTVSIGQNCTFAYGDISGNATLNGGSLVLNGSVLSGNLQSDNGGSQLSTTGGSTIHGNVQMNGGTFYIGASTTIDGNLQIQNGSSGCVLNQICGANVKGNLQFQNNSAGVDIGLSSSCPGNDIDGNLQVQNNSASTQIYNNTVGGNLQDQNNTAATVIDGNTVKGNMQVENNRVSTQVFSNSVANNLQFQNNTSITGGADTARQKQGQCSSF
jgi:hypothetical protein